LISPTHEIGAIVLAGERPGSSELAIAQDKPAGVLVSVAGKSCIEYVIAALRSSAAVRGGVIVGPSAAITESDSVMQSLIAAGDFQWVAPAIGPSASALRALDCLNRYPALLTAGDHALLEPSTVDEFCTMASRVTADFVIGLVPHDIVQSQFPESRRTILRFSDGAFCGSNLFLINNEQGKAALHLWTRIEANRKRPWRIAHQLGWRTMVKYLRRALSGRDVCQILSGASGCAVDFCAVNSARAAVDVDSSDDLQLAERILIGG
jgi:GTP:adenosylcobinamide-phosphate guanylyltransferase